MNELVPRTPGNSLPAKSDVQDLVLQASVLQVWPFPRQLRLSPTGGQ